MVSQTDILLILLSKHINTSFFLLPFFFRLNTGLGNTSTAIQIRNGISLAKQPALKSTFTTCLFRIMARTSFETNKDNIDFLLTVIPFLRLIISQDIHDSNLLSTIYRVKHKFPINGTFAPETSCTECSSCLSSIKNLYIELGTKTSNKETVLKWCPACFFVNSENDTNNKKCVQKCIFKPPLSLLEDLSSFFKAVQSKTP